MLELSRKTIDAIEIKLLKNLVISVDTSEMMKTVKQSEAER